MLDFERIAELIHMMSPKEKVRITAENALKTWSAYSVVVLGLKAGIKAITKAQAKSNVSDGDVGDCYFYVENLMAGIRFVFGGTCNIVYFSGTTIGDCYIAIGYSNEDAYFWCPPVINGTATPTLVLKDLEYFLDHYSEFVSYASKEIINGKIESHRIIPNEPFLSQAQKRAMIYESIISTGITDLEAIRAEIEKIAATVSQVMAVDKRLETDIDKAYYVLEREGKLMPEQSQQTEKTATFPEPWNSLKVYFILPYSLPGFKNVETNILNYYVRGLEYTEAEATSFVNNVGNQLSTKLRHEDSYDKIVGSIIDISVDDTRKALCLASLSLFPKNLKNRTDSDKISIINKYVANKCQGDGSAASKILINNYSTVVKALFGPTDEQDLLYIGSLVEECQDEILSKTFQMRSITAV